MSILHILKRKLRSCRRQQDAVLAAQFNEKSVPVVWNRSHLIKWSMVAGIFEIVTAKPTNASISLNCLRTLWTFFRIERRTDRRIVQWLDAQNMNYCHNEEKHAVDEPREKCPSLRSSYSANNAAQNNYENQECHGCSSCELFSHLSVLDPAKKYESAYLCIVGAA